MRDVMKKIVFLTDNEEIFIPEDFSEEQKLIFRTTKDFVDNEVQPLMERIEEQEEDVIKGLIKKAAEIGLVGLDIEEKYGGVESDFICSTIVAECMGRGGSFCVTFGGQTGIGTLPIAYFGNEKQKEKYLPGIVSGEIITAYALTEPEAGSDAFAIRTKAKLDDDGKWYVLNGTKQFITNAGYADLFIVFAKVDGEKFTAFIVERNTENFLLGPEERKMGIKGSSTRQLIFEGARVPAENVLYEIGRGHVVALNILNVGRVKVAANALGIAKYALELATKYANERKQFGKRLLEFGIIREKIAKMCAGIFAAESVLYRTAGLVNAALERAKKVKKDEYSEKIAQELSSILIECAMTKVFCTDILSYIVDEAVQIHGGYGFIKEYPVERLYRDARIYRIFEGTNEINCLAIAKELVKRLEVSLLEEEKKDISGSEGISKYESVLNTLKNTLKLLILKVREKGREREQEISWRVANAAICLYALDSMKKRCQKMAIIGEKDKHICNALFKVMARDLTIKCVASLSELTKILGEDMFKQFTDLIMNILNDESVKEMNIIAVKVEEKSGYPLENL